MNFADTQGFEDFIAAHIGQIEIQQNDIVIIELAEIDAFFTQIGGVAVETFRLQH